MICVMSSTQIFALLFVAFCSNFQPSHFQMASRKFFYFGYGSNLLSKRILINNPTAVRKGVAKLPGYRLDFNGYAERWGGAVATIVPDEKREVWGALWQMNTSDVGHLDRQEGVDHGIYEPLTVRVVVSTAADGGDNLVSARTYRYIKDQFPSGAMDTGLSLGLLWGALPPGRCPSPEYRRVVVLGALESGLPPEYVKALEAIPHNGYTGESGLNVIPRQEFLRRGPALPEGEDGPGSSHQESIHATTVAQLPPMP